MSNDRPPPATPENTMAMLQELSESMHAIRMYLAGIFAAICLFGVLFAVFLFLRFLQAPG